MKLKSGQTVEILTANWGSPSPKWLEFAVTGQARSQILNALKNLKNDKAYTLGVNLLNRELSRYNLNVEQLTKRQQQNLKTIFNMDTFSQLLTEIGLGNLLALVVASQLAPTKEGEVEPIPLTQGNQIKPLVIRGMENMLVNFATCCYPIPYEDITAILSKGKGITIHRSGCHQLHKYRNQPDRLLFVEWEKDVKGEFLVELRIETRNIKGILAGVTTAVANMGINIDHVNSYNSDALLSIIELCLYTKDRTQLASIIRNLRRVNGVHHIQRIGASSKN